MRRIGLEYKLVFVVYYLKKENSAWYLSQIFIWVKHTCLNQNQQDCIPIFCQIQTDYFDPNELPEKAQSAESLY